MPNETIFNSFMKTNKTLKLNCQQQCSFYKQFKKNFNWRWKSRRGMMEVCHRTWLCRIKISNWALMICCYFYYITLQTMKHFSHHSILNIEKNCFNSTLSRFFSWTFYNVVDVHTPYRFWSTSQFALRFNMTTYSSSTFDCDQTHRTSFIHKISHHNDDKTWQTFKT